MSDTVTDWTVRTRDHKFTDTGRRAVLRKSPPATVLMAIDAINPETGDVALSHLPVPDMARALFHKPRIAGPGEEAAHPDVIAFDDLEGSEVAEIISLFLEEVGRANRFLQVKTGDGSGGGRASVANPAKPRARTATRVA